MNVLTALIVAVIAIAAYAICKELMEYGIEIERIRAERCEKCRQEREGK